MRFHERTDLLGLQMFPVDAPPMRIRALERISRNAAVFTPRALLPKKIPGKHTLRRFREHYRQRDRVDRAANTGATK